MRIYIYIYIYVYKYIEKYKYLVKWNAFSKFILIIFLMFLKTATITLFNFMCLKRQRKIQNKIQNKK